MARRIRTLILATLLLFTAHIHAQDTESPTVSFKFNAYRIGSGDFSQLRYFEEKDESTPLRLGRYSKGPDQEYHGPRNLVFFKETPAPTSDDPDALARTPLVRVYIPEGVHEGILLFRKTPNGKGTFDAWLLDAAATRFPNNSLLVFNATGVRLVGKVGDTQAYFQPGPAKPISLTPYLDQGLPAAFLVETESGPQYVFEKTLEYSRNRRVILLLESPRQQGSLRISVSNLIEVMDEED